VFTARSIRSFATALAAAQLLAVAHLALVPHTASSSGALATRGHAIEEHLDALAHHGAHAHAPSPQQPVQGEEHCTILALLSASSAPQAAARSVAPVALWEEIARTTSSRAPSRRELLLAAPKASPPALPLS
jgi:hypothetical protein